MKYKYISLNLLTPFTKDNPYKIGDNLILFSETVPEILSDQNYIETKSVLRNFEHRKLTVIESNLEVWVPDLLGLMQLNQFKRLDEIKIISHKSDGPWFSYVPTQFIMHYENRSLVSNWAEQYATNFLDEMKCIQLQKLLPMYQFILEHDSRIFERLLTSHKFCNQYWRYLNYEHNIEEAFLKIIMSFEALLHFGNFELLKSMKERLRIINESEPTSNFARFYDQRSKYIHTGKIKSSKSKSITLSDFKEMEILICETHKNLINKKITFHQLKEMYTPKAKCL